MRLLFIKLKHIGDALLLTPTLDAVRRRHPQAEISVLVRKGSEGILAGCSAIDHLYVTVAAEKENRSRKDLWATVRLLRELRRTTFDVVFVISPEDRATFYGTVLNARRRIIATGARSGLAKRLSGFFLNVPVPRAGKHEVERNYGVVRGVLDLPARPGPLIFHDSENPGDIMIAGRGEYAVLHTTTRWSEKAWPLKHWISLIERIVDRFDSVVVSVGPARGEVAMGRLNERRFDNRVVSTEGRASWPQLASLIRGSQLFVGVDTAAMHLAAACDVPIVTLFGPSRRCFWRPWTESPCIVLSDPDYPAQNDIFADHRNGRRMDAITPSMIVSAIERILSAATPTEKRETASCVPSAI